MLLILLGDGVVAGVLLAKSKSNNAGWIVITAAWAFAVFVGVVVAGPISGAHLNPAVTIGLAVNGSTPWDQVPVYLVGELVGAMIGAILVLIHYWDHFKATEDQGLKLAVFSTGPNIRNYGAQLRLRGHRHLRAGVRHPHLRHQRLRRRRDHRQGRHGGPRRPARRAPRVVDRHVARRHDRVRDQPGPRPGPAHHPPILPVPGKGGSDWGYSWVPVVGPIVGGILAALVYQGVWVGVMGM